MYVAKTKALISFAVTFFSHMQNVGFLMTRLICFNRVKKKEAVSCENLLFAYVKTKVQIS